MNEDSIKFSLSTWTRSSSKASQSKFLHPLYISWCKHITSSLSSLSGMYICSFFMTNPSFTVHSSSLSIFIPAFFSSSTAFTTFLSFSYAFLVFPLRLLSSTNVSVLFYPPWLDQCLVLVVIFYSLLPIWSPTQPICLSHALPWNVPKGKVKLW